MTSEEMKGRKVLELTWVGDRISLEE